MMSNEPLFILCRPSHPGNIGAAARAMKTMGLSKLVLVAPKQFPDPEATRRATHAADILASCQVFDTIAQATENAELILGTTARQRTLDWPLYTPRQAIDHINTSQISHHRVAFLFGNERTGLHNEELSCVHGLIHIPTNPQCAALNLAACVQIIAYEYALTDQPLQPLAAEPHANGQQLRHFYNSLHDILARLNFFTATNPNHVMNKIQCLINRSQPSQTDIALLHGVVTKIRQNLSNHNTRE